MVSDHLPYLSHKSVFLIPHLCLIFTSLTTRTTHPAGSQGLSMVLGKHGNTHPRLLTPLPLHLAGHPKVLYGAWGFGVEPRTSPGNDPCPWGEKVTCYRQALIIPIARWNKWIYIYIFFFFKAWKCFQAEVKLCRSCLGRIDLIYSTLVSPQPWALSVPLSPAQP